MNSITLLDKQTILQSKQFTPRIIHSQHAFIRDVTGLYNNIPIVWHGLSLTIFNFAAGCPFEVTKSAKQKALLQNGY